MDVRVNNSKNNNKSLISIIISNSGEGREKALKQLHIIGLKPFSSVALLPSHK
jgi:hypothetical protein